MKDILLIVLILAFFAFGYFMVDRLGKSLKEHRRKKEADRLPNDPPDREDYEIIVCKKEDPDLVKCLERSDAAVERVFPAVVKDGRM